MFGRCGNRGVITLHGEVARDLVGHEVQTDKVHGYSAAIRRARAVSAA